MGMFDFHYVCSIFSDKIVRACEIVILVLCKGHWKSNMGHFSWIRLRIFEHFRRFFIINISAFPEKNYCIESFSWSWNSCVIQNNVRNFSCIYQQLLKLKCFYYPNLEICTKTITYKHTTFTVHLY